MQRMSFDHVLLFLAFISSLIAYVALSWHGSSVSRLEDIMLMTAGALAGVAVPRKPNNV